MDEQTPRVQYRLKVAAALVISGLLIEVGTLYWGSPLSFMLFIGLGGTLVGVGILVYLVGVVAA
jgi:hypothetical protein